MNDIEISILIIGNSANEDEGSFDRDIIIRPKSENNRLQRISEINQWYDPMSYVLMFPNGQLGWNINTVSHNNSDVKITAMDYYSFRLMYRNDNNHLHLFGKLFHQFIVDMYAKIEHCRLSFIRHNQTSLRRDVSDGIQDAVLAGDPDLSNVGVHIVLPSSFIDGPRHMAQLY